MTQKTIVAFAVGTAILLLVGLGPMPLGYYTFLRWGVMVLALWLCVMAQRERKIGWLFPLVPTAILFNPIVPVYLTRQTWAPFDIVAALMLPIAAVNIARPQPT